MSQVVTDDSMSDDVFEDESPALRAPAQRGTPSPTGYRDYQAPADTPYSAYRAVAEEEVPIHKTILLGDSGVGKTSLLVQFETGKFQVGNFSATVGIGFTNIVTKPQPSEKSGDIEVNERQRHVDENTSEDKISLEPPPTQRRRANPPELLEAEMDMTETISNKVINQTQTTTVEDDYDRYGKTLANRLRKLPEIHSVQLMQEIDGLYLRKLQQLQNVYSYPSTTCSYIPRLTLSTQSSCSSSLPYSEPIVIQLISTHPSSPSNYLPSPVCSTNPPVITTAKSSKTSPKKTQNKILLSKRIQQSVSQIIPKPLHRPSFSISVPPPVSTAHPPVIRTPELSETSPILTQNTILPTQQIQQSMSQIIPNSPSCSISLPPPPVCTTNPPVFYKPEESDTLPIITQNTILPPQPIQQSNSINILPNELETRESENQFTDIINEAFYNVMD